MKEILTQLDGWLSRGARAAWAGITSARGSLPMSRRSRMLVLSDGSQIGTVGGGCLEADVHALASRSMRTGEAILHRYTLTEAKAGAEGLNCGGTVEILVEPLLPEDRQVLAPAAAALAEASESVLLTAVTEPDAESGACRVTGRGLVGWKGLRAGSGSLADASRPDVAEAVEEALAILGQDRALFQRRGPGRLLVETLNVPPTLFIFGGGHVSLALAQVARTAGFRIVVVDDRPGFACRERFPQADETLVLPMESAIERLPIDRNSYIVAVTRGHQHDEPVIEQAIRTPAAYIGMIGSRRKVAIMRERLARRGAAPEQLRRVHAPIGLPIGADSPGEIAVSIVAQLIEHRRRPSG